MTHKNEYIEKKCQTPDCKEYSFCMSNFCDYCRYKKLKETRRKYSLKWSRNLKAEIKK